jgi:hypothetical protein
MQFKDIVFESKIEYCYILLFLLPSAELVPCGEKIWYTDNLMEKTILKSTPPETILTYPSFILSKEYMLPSTKLELNFQSNINSAFIATLKR